MTQEQWVEQADRDAAAAYYYSAGGSQKIATEIREGKKDDWFRVQAFAHHRQQAVAAERERCATWLRDDEQGRLVEGKEIEEVFYDRDQYTGEECTWTEKRKPRRLRTRFDLADAIERGEHAAIRQMKETAPE